ncbi:MAG: hypothetical protein QOG67_1186 [Verrucomicrobiota bacterium]
MGDADGEPLALRGTVVGGPDGAGSGVSERTVAVASGDGASDGDSDGSGVGDSAGEGDAVWRARGEAFGSGVSVGAIEGDGEGRAAGVASSFGEGECFGLADALARGAGVGECRFFVDVFFFLDGVGSGVPVKKCFTLLTRDSSCSVAERAMSAVPSDRARQIKIRSFTSILTRKLRG